MNKLDPGRKFILSILVLLAVLVLAALGKVDGESALYGMLGVLGVYTTSNVAAKRSAPRK